MSKTRFHKVIHRKIDGKIFTAFSRHYTKKEAKKKADDYRNGLFQGKPIGNKSLARVVKDKSGYRVFIKVLPKE